MKSALQETWSRLVLILLFLLPLSILFLLPGRELLFGGFWFWLALLLSIWLIWAAIGVPKDSEAEGVAIPAGPRMIHPDNQSPVVREVMDVRLAIEQDGIQAYRGPLKSPPEAAFEKLKRALGPAVVPLIQEDEQLGAAVLLMPRRVERSVMERRVFPGVNWVLFFLTLITTTWAGAAHQGISSLREPGWIMAGLPYSIGLLAILGVHEMGHYFMAKRHGIRVTPPYFIPVPFALGTFGAFIQMKSPTENRKALFDVAVAGPLAGLMIAVPALLIGLRSSVLISSDPLIDPHVMHGTSVGSSILFAIIAKLSLGDALQYGHILQLHPLAFAGWIGLFVTALNLLPVGQLDGGHMARAMFGTRVGQTIETIAMLSLVLLSLFVWPGLFMWVLIVFFLAGRATPPLNDMTPLTPGRRWLGFATFLILLLILTPLPHAFWNEAGIYCPYL